MLTDADKCSLVFCVLMQRVDVTISDCGADMRERVGRVIKGIRKNLISELIP